MKPKPTPKPPTTAEVRRRLLPCLRCGKVPVVKFRKVSADLRFCSDSEGFVIDHSCGGVACNTTRLRTVDQLVKAWNFRKELPPPVDRCEGCKKPATCSDSEGTPLCQTCSDGLLADLRKGRVCSGTWLGRNCQHCAEWIYDGLRKGQFCTKHKAVFVDSGKKTGWRKLK